MVDGTWVAVEVVGALIVGGLLWAWLALRAPRRPTPALPAAREVAERRESEGVSTDAKTLPGATTRVRTPPRPPQAPATFAPTPAPLDPTGGLVGRLRQALSRSRAALQGRFDELFGRPVDESMLEELEEALLLADVGVTTAGSLVDRVRSAARVGDSEPRGVLRAAIRELLEGVHQPLSLRDGLTVVMVVGVNGSGKTTTIGKLAARWKREDKRVLLAAGDTFRAAAADQLEAWAGRAGVDLVRMEEGADPGAVVYQAVERAVAQGYDVLIIDTAGRLQTRKPLMAELEKLQRVIRKHVDDGPHETLLVLDGTMGQNGLSQATLFNEATPLTGVVVTKLDGTAKGGMVLTIASELALPVKLIGIGEGIDDLKDFDPRAFVDALA